ncbi:MAG: hypothetical protein ACQGVK_08470 [Myxococcota bacterium]
MSAAPEGRVWPRLRGLVFAVLAGVVAGSACNKEPHEARLYFDPSDSTVSIGTWVEVDVVVDVSEGSLQAFELAFQATPSTSLWIAEARTSDFDDDGQLFVSPVSDFLAGTLERVVDLRHGATPVTGTVRLAHLRIVPLQAGTATVTISSAGLAGAKGQTFELNLEPLSIEVLP